MGGLFLNSYPLTFRGAVELYEMRGAGETYDRRELRALAGVSVWLGRRDAFAYQEPASRLSKVTVISKALVPTDGLTLWAVREGIIAHCRSLGYDAWMGRAGELQIIGPIPAAIEDRFRIEHGLQVRVSGEDYVGADAILTVRHRTHWLCAGSLADPDVAARATGRRAVRLNGDGPLRGRVESIAGEHAGLMVGDEERTVPASDYTISVNSSFIANWRGSPVLRSLRVTAGELTTTGKRNRHGVQDRFKLAGDAVRAIGPVISLPGGAEIEIARVPVAVRLEEGV